MAEDERAELLNSMLKRGPNKRRIKPAENNELLALALGVDEESEEDDEDFEVDSEDEEGSFSGSEEEGTAFQRTNNNFQEKPNESDNSEESSDESEPVEKPVTVEEMLKTVKTTPKTTTPIKQLANNSEVKYKPADSLNLLICGICLGESSDEDDEIVECDNCGICVHESCYGISADDDTDTDSNDTSDTDSSTEPWFCDACKSGINPKCELCPDLGGIFKETLRGQWVHLVCALYTPGVTFDVPEKLENVVLVDLHPSKWGSKECDLCEDIALSRTGVCIGCDAGLCKTFFHATCAQRKGLLSELPEEDDEDVADPLYAHCKLHLDKTVAKKKRQAYLTYVSRVNKVKQTEVNKDRKERVEESLQVAREVYKEKKSLRAPPPPPKEMVSRSMLSCPEVLRQLLKKAELLGFVSQQQSKITNTFGNVRRKWHIPASFTVEFVNYFYDRGSRMESMKSRLDELTVNNKDMQEEEQLLRKKYDELSKATKTVTSQRDTTKSQCFKLHNLVCQLAEKELALPNYLENLKRSAKKEIVKTELKLSVCSKCDKSENQHLMVECDTCHSFYHLACVDPPLSRMPKKSRKMLWQCTECDSSSSEEEDVKADANDKGTLLESRQKRNIKEPAKFTPGRESNKKKRKRKSQQPSNQPKVQKVKAPRVRKQRPVLAKKIQPVDVRTHCSTCGQDGDNSNLVRCDECKLCFHFKCLDPPTKANPKPKGYLWYCTECDETPDEDSGEEQDEKTDTQPATTTQDITAEDQKSEDVAAVKMEVN